MKAGWSAPSTGVSGVSGVSDVVALAHATSVADSTDHPRIRLRSMMRSLSHWARESAQRRVRSIAHRQLLEGATRVPHHVDRRSEQKVFARRALVMDRCAQRAPRRQRDVARPMTRRAGLPRVTTERR
jgi:hypothetical protein